MIVTSTSPGIGFCLVFSSFHHQDGPKQQISLSIITFDVIILLTHFPSPNRRLLTFSVFSPSFLPFSQDDLDYIRTHTTLKHGEMCGVIFGMDCARKVTKNLNWTIAIPERKQSNNVKRSSSSSPSAAASAGAASTAGAGADDAEADLMSDIDYRDSYKSLAKLVQITDIHVDPYYEPGSEANCGEPLCCRSTNGPAKSRDRAAGPWGDYRNCDTPVPTLRHVLKHINEVHSDVSGGRDVPNGFD